MRDGAGHGGPAAEARHRPLLPGGQAGRRGRDEGDRRQGRPAGAVAGDADAQIEFINNLVSQKVGVIAIAGNDANAVAPALKRAAAQGLGVISYDSDVAQPVRAVFLNQAKSDSLAEQMLASMGKLIGFEGEFAILSSTPTATNQTPGWTS
jgi:rhamnose transport system substrate-binding protein